MEGDKGSKVQSDTPNTNYIQEPRLEHLDSSAALNIPSPTVSMETSGINREVEVRIVISKCTSSTNNQ